MILRAHRVDSTPDEDDPELKPAPHIRPDGSIGPPVGTLCEQFERVHGGQCSTAPEVLTSEQQQRFLNTLIRVPAFCREMARIVTGGRR